MNEKIEKMVKELLEHLSVPAPSIKVEGDQGSWNISIQSQDDRPMVGRDGERFDSFSHLVKRMLVKDIGEDARVTVDVNGRLARNVEALKTKAAIIAERARSFRHDIEMEPMSSYDRMIIHTALEGMPNIKTESVGSGRDRHLVVKYVEESPVKEEEF